jgi:hypothetical protein
MAIPYFKALAIAYRITPTTIPIMAMIPHTNTSINVSIPTP